MTQDDMNVWWAAMAEVDAIDPSGELYLPLTIEAIKAMPMEEYARVRRYLLLAYRPVECTS